MVMSVGLEERVSARPPLLLLAAPPVVAVAAVSAGFRDRVIMVVGGWL